MEKFLQALKSLKAMTELEAWCVSGPLFTSFIPTQDDLGGFTQWLFVACDNPSPCGDAEQSWAPEGEFTPGLQPWVSFPWDNPIPSNRLPHCAPQLHSWQGECW